MLKNRHYTAVMSWVNKNNGQYTADVLEQWASLGGLNSCPDLLAIADYITPAKTILEVGAGLGRVINFLTNTYPQKKITAIEKNPALCELLMKKQNSVEIITADIMTLHTKKNFDLILWLWSGLTDFAKQEQLNAVSHVASLLHKEGRLLIETFPHDAIPANGSLTTSSQHYVLHTDTHDLFGYIPSPDEMADYAKASGLIIEKIIRYTTDSGRNRLIYALKFI